MINPSLCRKNLILLGKNNSITRFHFFLLFICPWKSLFLGVKKLFWPRLCKQLIEWFYRVISFLVKKVYETILSYKTHKRNVFTKVPSFHRYQTRFPSSNTLAAINRYSWAQLFMCYGMYRCWGEHSYLCAPAPVS